MHGMTCHHQSPPCHGTTCYVDCHGMPPSIPPQVHLAPHALRGRGALLLPLPHRPGHLRLRPGPAGSWPNAHRQNRINEVGQKCMTEIRHARREAKICFRFSCSVPSVIIQHDFLQFVWNRIWWLFFLSQRYISTASDHALDSLRMCVLIESSPLS